MSKFERNDEFNRRLKTDPTAAREMIEANQGLVVSRVDVFCKRYPAAERNREDLVAAGNLALVVAVDDLAAADVEKPTAYLVISIDHAINDADSSATVVRDKRKHTRGTDCEPLPLMPIEAPTGATIDVWDAVLAACADVRDMELVTLRAAGHTDAEVSERLGVSRQRVVQLRAAIEQRFEEMVSA